MQTRIWNMVASVALCSALCGALWTGEARAQGDAPAAPPPDMSQVKPRPTPKHSPLPKQAPLVPGSDERADMMMVNADAVIATLSEEKTEIKQLAAQAAALKKMGGRQNRSIARMLERWVREHKAAGPMLVQLARSFKANLDLVKILKPPVLGSKGMMLHATMMDHMKAVQTSEARWKISNNVALKRAMHKRANLARKHMREMKRYHNAKNCSMCKHM